MPNDKYKLYANKKNYSKPYFNHNSIVIKSKGEGIERSKRKITPARVIEEETEELSKKPLCRPLSDKMMH